MNGKLYIVITVGGVKYVQLQHHQRHAIRTTEKVQKRGQSAFDHRFKSERGEKLVFVSFRPSLPTFETVHLW